MRRAVNGVLWGVSLSLAIGAWPACAREEIARQSEPRRTTGSPVQGEPSDATEGADDEAHEDDGNEDNGASSGAPSGEAGGASSVFDRLKLFSGAAAPTTEVWGGAETVANAWSVYGGMTTGVFGDVRRDGLKLRAGAGYGVYTYESRRWDGIRRSPVLFQGQHRFVDTSLGYQQTVGPLTIKVFAGLMQAVHGIRPFDIDNDIQGGRIGPKLALETWLNLGNAGYLQADANWSRVFATYGARVRLGHVLPIPPLPLSAKLSIGVEAAAYGNAAYDGQRARGFTRIKWRGGEASLSGGVSGDGVGQVAGYGTFNLLLRY